MEEAGEEHASSKERPVSAGDERNAGPIPGSGRSSGVENGNPFQYSRLENSVDSPWGLKESDMTD